MANQTITTSTNHDALTGRNAGEDIAIQQGAVLTIDSYPQDTAMGILGDLNIVSGEIHIDGRRVREVAYNSGTGSLPAVGTALTYGTSGTAKVINLTSGTATSGVITITIQGVFEEPTGTITDGSWSATVTSSKIGVLKVFGEDQIWDATNGTCTLRITGDWYEVAVGDGTDNQSITLPHSGRQHALWIETGSGTNVFQIWHRVNTTTSNVFFDSVSDWGNSFESGFVFEHIPGTNTVNFGTSTNGGAPPNGARIRMPNVHLGTTTVGAPQTEIISNVLAQHITIIDSLVTENVLIDHLNASTVDVTLNQTNGATISDSALGISGSGFIVNNAATVTITNSCFRGGQNIGTEGPANLCQVLDNLGGITFQDCVFVGGTNANNSGVLLLTTMSNATFEGINKVVSLEQDENSMASLRCTTSSRITNNGTLLLLNGSFFSSAGSVNLQLGDIAWGQLTSRGNTENTIGIINLAATDTARVNSGRYLTGSGVGPFRGAQIILTDSANVTIQNFGSVVSKLDNGGFGTTVFNLAGITNNVTFRRCYFTNLAASQMITAANSVSGVTFENCGTDYNDELEMDSSNFVAKGLHCASGALETSTGVEGDLVNVVGTTFYDHFKSDTTGAIGLVFASPGNLYAGNFQIVSGTPLFNGVGDLIMSTIGDQVIYTWPYEILGHTAFQNAALQLSGVNTGNLLYEYDLDTGSGFSGTYQTVNGANLSAESISPTGFRIRIRITTQSTATTSITGFAIRTNTTLADQAANLYPFPADRTGSVTGILTGSTVEIYNITQDTQLFNEVVSGTSVIIPYNNGSIVSDGDIIRITINKTSGLTSYLTQTITSVAGASGFSALAAQEIDTVYTFYNIDGSTITKFSPDYVNNRVDFTTTSDYTATEWYAWFKNNLATLNGNANWSRIVRAIDGANLEIDQSVKDLLFNITNTTNVIQTDNIRIFRKDGSYPVLRPTTGGGAIDIVWRNVVYLAEVGTSGLTPEEAATLGKIDTLTEDVSGLRFTTKALEQAPSGGGGGSSDWTSLEKEQIRNRLGIDGTASDPVSANPTLALETDITSSQTAIIAQIDANEVKIDEIKAKTDTLVNTDLAPVLTAISNLNDLSAAEVLTQMTNALNTYDSPTKAELDSAVTTLLLAIGSGGVTASEIYDYFAFGTRPNIFKADLTSVLSAIALTSTSAEITAQTSTLLTAIGSGGVTPAEVYDYFTALTRADAFKADLASVLSAIALTATSAELATQTTTLLSAIGSGGVTPSEIYNYFVALTRADAFKADISSLATTAQLEAAKNEILSATVAIDIPAIVSAVRADLERLGGPLALVKIDTTQIISNIANLNDISATDVYDEVLRGIVDTNLVDEADLLSLQTIILTAINNKVLIKNMEVLGQVVNKGQIKYQVESSPVIKGVINKNELVIKII